MPGFPSDESVRVHPRHHITLVTELDETPGRATVALCHNCPTVIVVAIGAARPERELFARLAPVAKRLPKAWGERIVGEGFEIAISDKLREGGTR